MNLSGPVKVLRLPAWSREIRRCDDCPILHSRHDMIMAVCGVLEAANGLSDRYVLPHCPLPDAVAVVGPVPMAITYTCCKCRKVHLPPHQSLRCDDCGGDRFEYGVA